MTFRWAVPFVACAGVLFGVVPVPQAAAQDLGINEAEFPKLNAKTDWPWWRGPNRDGKAVDPFAPVALEAAEAKWAADVPGRGHSSPTVVGNRVYLTTADEATQTHFVLAFDRATGAPAWQVPVNQGAFPARNHPKNTEATPTVACDGERLFATFYHHDMVELMALDLEGKILWRKPAGAFRPRRYEYGYAPSPVIYHDGVIVAAEYDGDSFIAAFDRKTGKQVWRTPRPNNITFSTPSIAHVGGRDQLLISGAQQVAAFAPQTGKPLWSLPGTTFATCGTMVWDGDVVYASGGYPDAQTIAIRATGSGTVLWKNNQKCYEQSMLAHNGYLYALTDNGVLFCWRGSDGKVMWTQRLKGPVSASPVLAGDQIYWANEEGTLYVFRANPERYELIRENHVGDDAFPSPAICGGQVYLRVGHRSPRGRQEKLYCFEISP